MARSLWLMAFSILYFFVWSIFLVAGDGIEPPVFGLWARRDTISPPRSIGYCLYSFGELGFEPRQTESKSVVLPLDDSPIFYIPSKISCMYRSACQTIMIWQCIARVFDRGTNVESLLLLQKLRQYLWWCEDFILLAIALYDARQSSAHQKTTDICHDQTRWSRKRVDRRDR